MSSIESGPSSLAETPRSSRKILWLRIAAILVLCGFIAGIREAYWHNQLLLFLSGLAALLGTGAVWLHFEEPRVARFGWEGWKRFAACCLMLALIEGGYRLAPQFGASVPESGAIRRDGALTMVTYREAKNDPQAFDKWWGVYLAEGASSQKQITQPTPGEPVPYVFKPNSSAPIFNTRVEVNSLGLIGKEVPFDKGDAYRIVVVGASHSAGTPMQPGDRTWPEWLEEKIRAQAPAGREVQVLNAAGAGLTMEHCLHRLKTVVLPLKPDMIITYFGNLEFSWLRSDFRLPHRQPTLRSPRASVMIRKVESRYSKWWASWKKDPPAIEDFDPLVPRLEQCRLARKYQEYIQTARDNGIQLVVCNFGMAVNNSSPPDAIQFYSQSYPDAKFLMEANRVNTAMLPLVIRPESGARLIDIQDGFDGAYEDLFIDLVHLTDAGGEKLADNVLRGIADLLPSSGSRPVPPLASHPEDKTSLR